MPSPSTMLMQMPRAVCSSDAWRWIEIRDQGSSLGHSCIPIPAEVWRQADVELKSSKSSCPIVDTRAKEVVVVGVVAFCWVRFMWSVRLTKDIFIFCYRHFPLSPNHTSYPFRIPFRRPAGSAEKRRQPTSSVSTASKCYHRCHRH